MKIHEIIREAIQPIQPVAAAGQGAEGPAGLDQSIQQAQTDQQPTNKPPTAKVENRYVPIIQAIRRAANKQPVNKTGNAGIDNLLFNISGLAGDPNTFDKMASTLLAPDPKIKKSAYADKKIRSGTDIRKGIPTDEPTTLTPGVAGAKGLSTEINNRVASQAEVVAKIKEMATMSTVPQLDPRTQQPEVDDNGNEIMVKVAVANSTKNAGIDNLLKSAEVRIQGPATGVAAPVQQPATGVAR